MIKILKYSVAAAATLILATGCTTKVRQTDFTVISTKNVELSKMGDFERDTKRTTGEERLTIFIIPSGDYPTIKGAIDNTIEKVPGAVALVDGVVYSETFSAPFYSEFAYVVEGTALIDPKLLASLPSNYLISKFDETSKSYKLSYVNETEFNTLKEKYTNTSIKKSM
jgi:hypothetical protein